MLHLNNDLLLRAAALTAACTAALAAPELLQPPEARAIEIAAAPSEPPAFELAELAELERAAGDLEHLRGGDLNLTTGETLLLVLGVVIVILLVA